MVLVLALLLVNFVTFDQAGVLGLSVGVVLGLANMAVTFMLVSNMQSMTSIMSVLMGGFLVRLVLLVSLMLWFQRVEAVDATAFALGFMILFFVNVAFEIQLVSRGMQNGGTA